MKRIKFLLRIAAVALFAVITAVSAMASTPAPAAGRINLSDETINYKVLFKWGLIHKVAGRARLEMKASGESYTASVYARSEPWADRIFMLRDTLTSVMNRTTLAPRYYRKSAHEGGKYTLDEIRFTQFDNAFHGECIRTRRDKNSGKLTTTTTRLDAQGMTVDFLSAFYYLRSLDFATMSPGNTVAINIFSGRRKETLRFHYRGLETIKINDRRQSAYKVEFTFTSDGKKETSDPVVAWVTTDASRIPLQIEGKLKVGKIRCVLEN